MDSCDDMLEHGRRLACCAQAAEHDLRAYLAAATTNTICCQKHRCLVHMLELLLVSLLKTILGLEAC